MDVPKIMKAHPGGAEMVKHIYQHFNGSEENNSKMSHKVGRFFEVTKDMSSQAFLAENDDYKPGNTHILSLSPNVFPGHISVPLTLDFIIYDYVIPVVAVIGIMLIMLGIYLISTGPRRGKMYSLFLSTLLLFDAGFLFFEVLKNLGNWITILSSKSSRAYYLVVTLAIRYFEISSIFMLIALSHVRYCAIKKPFQYNSNILSRKERKMIWARHCIPVIISSIILTVPILMQQDFSIQDETEAGIHVATSSIRLDIIYAVCYAVILNFGLLGILPTVCLVYLAYKIRRELIRIEVRQKSLTPRIQRRQNAIEEEQGVDPDSKSGNKSKNAGRTSNEIKMTRSLITGIKIFMALYTFRMVTTFTEFCILLYWNKDNEALNTLHYLPSWIHAAASLSELFMVINSSIRALIHVIPLEVKLNPETIHSLRHNLQRKGSDTSAIRLTDIAEDKTASKQPQKEETHCVEISGSMTAANARRRLSAVIEDTRKFD